MLVYIKFLKSHFNSFIVPAVNQIKVSLHQRVYKMLFIKPRADAVLFAGDIKNRMY